MGDLHCKLVPGARKNEILGWETDANGRKLLRIRLQAPPLEGKANRSLIAYLSDRLDVPKASITLRQGAKSRIKRLEFASLSSAEIRERLAE
jgi:hypothetical protein